MQSQAESINKSPVVAIGDLYRGMGGFREAWDRIGALVRYAIDNDEDAIDAYAMHAKRKGGIEGQLTDIADIPTWLRMREAQVDAISSGFPCGPFTELGQRRQI